MTGERRKFVEFWEMILTKIARKVKKIDAIKIPLDRLSKFRSSIIPLLLLSVGGHPQTQRRPFPVYEPEALMNEREIKPNLRETAFAEKERN